MEKAFTNLADLKGEIARLKLRKKEQEKHIGDKFSSPLASAATIITLFKGKDTGEKKPGLESLYRSDLVSALSRVVLPFMVNKLFFPKAGFITRAIATFISRKAAKKVDSDMLAGVIGKVKGLFGDKKRTKRRLVTDYGIPPDSETY